MPCITSLPAPVNATNHLAGWPDHAAVRCCVNLREGCSSSTQKLGPKISNAVASLGKKCNVFFGNTQSIQIRVVSLWQEVNQPLDSLLGDCPDMLNTALGRNHQSLWDGIPKNGSSTTT